MKKFSDDLNDLTGYTQLLTGFRQTMPFQKARQLWYSTSALQNSQSDTNLSQMSPANKVDTKLLNPDEPLASKNQVTQSNDGTSQQGNIPQNLFDINETRDPSGNSLEGAEDSDVNALQKSMGKPKSQGHIKYLKTRNRKQMNHIPEENREHDSRKHIPGGIAGPDRNHNIQNQVLYCAIASSCHHYRSIYRILLESKSYFFLRVIA